MASAYTDLALVEWPNGPGGSPRLLGRLADADLVQAVRDRLAEARRRELASLEGRPLRLIDHEPDGGDAA